MPLVTKCINFLRAQQCFNIFATACKMMIKPVSIFIIFANIDVLINKVIYLFYL